jgi:serine O-acetyltransferase
MPVTRESGSTAVETPSVDQGLSASSLSNVDPLWTRVREEAEAAREQDPVLSQVLLTSILLQTRLEDAVIHRVASRLDHPDIPGSLLRQVFTQEIAADPDIASAIRADVVAIYERDPACHRFIEPILFFKGFHALTAYRFAHRLWHEGRKDFALFIQSRVSATFGVDIHPAARIGRGILVDHATGIVVGETAVVEDEVSMLHGVTLGGSGKEDGDRHPKVRRGVLLGAGAKVLGNIEIGHCSRVASGSVVLKDVPPLKTVAGVPARIVGESGCPEPSLSMDHMLEFQPPIGTESGEAADGEAGDGEGR